MGALDTVRRTALRKKEYTMALQRSNRPAALRRRVTTYTLAGDVVAALVVGLVTTALIGWIVFAIGLVVASFVYYNFTQVMRTRGY